MDRKKHTKTRHLHGRAGSHSRCQAGSHSKCEAGSDGKRRAGSHGKNCCRRRRRVPHRYRCLRRRFLTLAFYSNVPLLFEEKRTDGRMDGQTKSVLIV